MDWCTPPRLKLMLPIAFLLISTNIDCLHGYPITGEDHNLHCVSDYLFTINCSLSIAPSENISDSSSSYQLTFIETFEKVEFKCMLTNNNGDYSCSINTSEPMSGEIFGDTDVFEISLCHNQNNGSDICEVLDEEYAPVRNIKPNAPCCLTVSHNSSQHHFTWKSTYEEYSRFTALILMYQLHFYKRGDTHNVTSHAINTESMYYSVDDHEFLPGTEYAARVRSSPNQAFYMGEWSDWSYEVYWKTESGVYGLPANTSVSGLGKVFISLCVTVPLILLLCYVPVKKWKQSTFIPTPAPYFHTLYNDFQGDFKSWVVTQENTADILKAEVTLQIDMTKCAYVQEEACHPHFHHQLMESSTYSNITDPGFNTSLLGTPDSVSTMLAPGGSLKSLNLNSQPGSPEGDSGCWLCSHTSLERDLPWYCNDYCTLSTFQQTNPVPAEHHGNPPA